MTLQIICLQGKNAVYFSCSKAEWKEVETIPSNHACHHPLHSARLCRTSSRVKVADTSDGEEEATNSVLSFMLM